MSWNLSYWNLIRNPSPLLPVLEVWGGGRRCQECVLIVQLWPIDELWLTLQCLRLNELSWCHGSMTAVLQKAELCAATTKQRPCLCLGSGTAERACLDSEWYIVLYSHQECPVSSPGVIHSVSTATISHSNLTEVKCLWIATHFLVSLHVLPFKHNALSWAAKEAFLITDIKVYM